jgi:bifunctional UDP-N-acetylglucosamine pyrophosphorylase/glucosamine-1-phosphate N-acetyltransferase
MGQAELHVVILAAGQGTRMRSRLPKVVHAVAGRPMALRVLDVAESLEPATVTFVVGHGADLVRECLHAYRHLRFAVQEPQLGTAHALQQVEPVLSGRTGTLVLLSADVPLLRADTLQRLVQKHQDANAAATVVTASVERPYGYGRIVRANGRIARIVEERDATDAERQLKEINSGIYAFDVAPLFDALRGIAAKNAQGEYYLTDLVAIYRSLSKTRWKSMASTAAASWRK